MRPYLGQPERSCGLPDGHKRGHLSLKAQERQIEKQREWHRERYATDPIYREAARQAFFSSGYRFQRHGIDLAAAEGLFEAQGRACAGCDEPAESVEALQVDHDHNCCSGTFSCGKCIRGLLCPGCNQLDVLAEVS